MTSDDAILLVEDNPDDVLFMKRACRQVGIIQALHIVEHGQAAIDFMGHTGSYTDKVQYPTPRLILLDLKLPYKSGLEVLQWIRAQELFKTVPVIIFTTSAENSDIERAYRFGANAYLVKPANMNELANILKSLKEFWINHNFLPRISRSAL
jgi:CheY-like chemotaxis protein